MNEKRFPRRLLAVLIATGLCAAAAVPVAAQMGDMSEEPMQPMMSQRGGAGGMGMMMGPGMGMMGGGMCMMGRGMMSGMNMMGMRGMMGLGPIGMLDLTDDQRRKITKIQDEKRKKHWEIMGKIMDEQAKLRDLYQEDELDAKKIGAVYDNIFKLRQQMIEAHIQAINQARAVLTKEQREQLKRWWRHGGMGMMGPAGMRGGYHRWGPGWGMAP
jgi:Spy/CpxP family protein refolding chaperone